MEVTTQLYLGGADDRCDHPDATVDLPQLRATVDVAGREGWGDLVLHWTGNRWEHCDEPDWSVHGLVTDEELSEAAERGLAAANAVTGSDWRTRYRDQAELTLRVMREKLEYEELRVRCLRTKIRSLECLAAAADLQGEPAAVARRLMRGWAGTADDLVATANALAATGTQQNR